MPFTIRDRLVEQMQSVMSHFKYCATCFTQTRALDSSLEAIRVIRATAQLMSGRVRRLTHNKTPTRRRIGVCSSGILVRSKYGMFHTCFMGMMIRLVGVRIRFSWCASILQVFPEHLLEEGMYDIVCNSADVQAMFLVVHQVQCPVLESKGIYITRFTSKEIGDCFLSKCEVVV